MHKQLTLLNTSILTEFGTYRYESLASSGTKGIEEARALLAQFRQAGKSIQSAIGHQATADLLSVLLEYPVAMNRMEFKQTVDDLGLIFKLKTRAPEGMILTLEEIEAIGYEFGLLTRVE